jgi:photosystem II stability/assembly factor-like uncharacterized protein
MRLLRRTLLAVIAFAAPAFAGVNQWTVVGPPVSVRAMAVDPHNNAILYAAGDGAVARSYDRGATWTVTSVPGLNEPLSIRVATSMSSTLYVLGASELYRSNDGGVSWQRRTLPTSGQFPNELQADSRNSSVIVLVASNFCLFGCTGGGVFRSDDGGGSWSRIGLKDTNVYAAALDPTSSQVVYASTGSKLMKTANGGKSWNDITPAGIDRMQNVAVDPVMNRVIYAATNGAIFRSDDAGQSWNTIREAPYGGLVFVPAYASRQLFVAADSLLLSVDQGESWRSLTTVGSGLEFGSLWQLATGGDVFYMVSDLHAMPGQILAYQIVPPRRRAAAQ